ncbi:MAG: hypothetical protein K0R65_1214 [Crocinitomicaceae bacterium]|jgi:hypothetical protein|nr:hypothetical protein [Crocinitomicaceae bacterium]
MRLAVFSIAFLTCCSLLGQSSAYVKKGELQIGEQTELVYEFPFEGEAQNLKFQPYTKIIPCLRRSQTSMVSSGDAVNLEIIGEFKDTILTKKGYKLWRGTYKITVWDTGYLVIPSASIIFNDSISDFVPVLLTVKMPKLEDGKDIYDIKESFVEVENDYISWILTWWWAILLFIIALIAVIIYVRRSRRPKIVPKKLLTLKDRSLFAVDGLENARLWEKGKVKEHYIEFSFILRSYLGGRYNVNLLEKTSHETALLLTQLNLSPDTVQTIKTILDYSDLVKFAKSVPAEFDILRNLAQSRQIIVETSPLEIEPHVD